MESDILYDNEEQKKATERVLSILRIKSLNETIDTLVSEILKYAINIDKILERNNFTTRYLDKVSQITELDELTLDDDLEDADFRVKEVVEDLIKRINTRIKLVNDNNALITEIESNTDLANADLMKDIETAKLREEDFA
jgi:hypothetical protein